MDSKPPPASTDIGVRLAAHEQRLRMLLFHLAGRAVRARVELDDLAQEVYLRAVTSDALPPAEPGDPALWRYLARLARNTVIDVARSIRARKRSGTTVPLARSDWSRAGPSASQILAQTAGPATRVIAGETSARLFEQYQSLAPEHRRVIGLRQFEGLTAREAAQRMGRSETAIHSLYRRALVAWESGIEDPSGAPPGLSGGTSDESPRP